MDSLKAEPSSTGELVPSQRRLQRLPDFTGNTLDSFTPVFSRHGLPGLLLGLACLLHPDMRLLLHQGLGQFLDAPFRYGAIGAGILCCIIAYAWHIDRRIDGKAVAWIGYLFLVSFWEEWVFRLALPYFAESRGIDLRTGVLLSNLAFGLMHYFTLRWKWQWCLGAAIGGLALSRQMGLHFDLALLVGIHWIATFLNTPRLPGRRRTVASHDPPDRAHNP